MTSWRGRSRWNSQEAEAGLTVVGMQEGQSDLEIKPQQEKWGARLDVSPEDRGHVLVWDWCHSP